MACAFADVARLFSCFTLYVHCTGSGKVVHVKNLAYTASQEQLKELFTGVEDIHMPLQANGKSRG